MLLAARFQGFARSLHAQTADAIAQGAHNARYRVLLGASLTRSIELSRVNAQPGSIAKDFERFGVDIWEAMARKRRDNVKRRRKLQALIAWRNAIAHDDIERRRNTGGLEPSTINLQTCRSWRSAANVLATLLDEVAADHCETLGLPRPW